MELFQPGIELVLFEKGVKEKLTSETEVGGHVESPVEALAEGSPFWERLPNVVILQVLWVMSLVFRPHIRGVFSMSQSIAIVLRRLPLCASRMPIALPLNLDPLDDPRRLKLRRIPNQQVHSRYQTPVSHQACCIRTSMIQTRCTPYEMRTEPGDVGYHKPSRMPHPPIPRVRYRKPYSRHDKGP